MKSVFWREQGQWTGLSILNQNGKANFCSTSSTVPVQVDHLQRWSQIFRRDRTETDPLHLTCDWNFPDFWGRADVFPVVASLPVRLLVRRLRSHGLHSRSQILHFVWSRRFKTNSTGDENVVTQVNRAKSIFGLPEALMFVTSENTLLFVLYVHLQNSFLQQKRFASELSFLRQN